MLRTAITTFRPRATIQLAPSLRSAFPIRSPALRRPLTTPSRPTRPNTNFTFSSPRSTPPTLLQRLRNSTSRFISNSRTSRNGRPTARKNNSGNGNAGAKDTKIPEDETSLGGRLKKLSREYGWSALGVYLALSALDFPFCYLLVRYLGADRVGEWEHIAVTYIEEVIPDSVKDKYRELRAAYWPTKAKPAEGEIGWGVEEAEVEVKNNANLATQLALAYAIHKSFIFIRVPLTATLTPKVVKVLRGWGWDIGKRTTKEAKALKRATNPVKSRRRRP